ncbi:MULTISPECIES: hypothetical protein [Chitinophagaceae]
MAMEAYFYKTKDIFDILPLKGNNFLILAYKSVVYFDIRAAKTSENPFYLLISRFGISNSLGTLYWHYIGLNHFSFKLAKQ